MAKSIEDGLRNPQVDVVSLKIDKVEPNPTNPNELPEDKMDTLKQEIRESGFKQPILVREKEDSSGWEIIDGEHRWRALRELGADSIPAVVVEAGDDEAKIGTISMNLLRGEFIPIKLALLLADLNKRISEDELSRRLGMEPTEIKDSLRLAAFTDELPDKVRQATEREEKEAPEVLQFVLNKRDAALVNRVIGKLTDEETDRAKALVKLAREYEKVGSD